ncbi:hypothetical protein AMTR_s00099p00068410 [Amborella trichopoda]|uniref:Uncharacterized protein n=1 Tax=Amborella trichopoda TaxID=13333 RepID=W1NVR9_AMBTC|nr:hypothetical protein AMTR_s00099p00068410 [Amborella trichopoda]
MDDNMEFQEWEILPESELGHPKNSDSSENQRNSAIVDEDSEGMIRPDYFAYDSVHLNKTNTNEEIAVPDELGFSDIGVSTWVDPCLTSIYAAREGKFSGMMGFGNENSNTSGSESGDFNEGKEVEALDPGGLMEIKGGLDPGNNSKESDPDSNWAL